jgi:hypothetical protein
MPCNPGLLESYEKDICALVASFSEKDTVGKQSLMQLLTSDARAFAMAGIRVLANAKPSPGARFLMYLLIKEKLLTPGLLDPGTSSLKDAIAAVTSIDQMGSNLQPALEMALTRALQSRATQDCADQVMRILDLLAPIAAQNCWPSFQSELMTYPNAAVRSKAALLIGRDTRNIAWISRRMMDKDARVQANAIEALWTMDAAESRPVFTAALRSANNRVAANAALGLYRIADLKAVKALLDMVRHADPLFRVSGLWAIAETEDPRFIPFLMEQFKSSQGKVKLAVTRALSRIRRHEKASVEKGPVQIHMSKARAKPDGGRHLEFALSRPGGDDISSVKPFEFALWEGGTLVEDYEVKLPNNPAALVIGIVAPRFLSTADLYGNAVAEGLKRCASLKRPDDWWRIDRYNTEVVPTDANAAESTLPYDDSLVTQELKTRKGFIAESGQLEKAIALLVPRERATPDAVRAIRRQTDAMDKSCGKRHLFVFVHESSVDLVDQESLDRLKELAVKEGITLYAFVPNSSGKFSGFRDLCLSVPGGVFCDLSVDHLADEFEQIYKHLLNRYEINYSVPATPEAGSVTVQLCSEYGVGRTEFSLTQAPE